MGIFLASSGQAQVATFQSPALHIPLVIVGERSFQVEMIQTASNPTEFTLVSVADSTAELESNAALYDGTTLTIQNVRVDEEQYDATLELVQNDPAIFHLTESSHLPAANLLTFVPSGSDPNLGSGDPNAGKTSDDGSSTLTAPPLDTRILIVSGFHTIFRIIKRQLGQLGYPNVDFFGADEEFEEQVDTALVEAKRNNNPYGLVLVYDDDYHDFGKSFNAMQANSEVRGTPAILLSPSPPRGFDLPRYLRRIGAIGHIEAPFNTATLKENLKI